MSTHSTDSCCCSSHPSDSTTQTIEELSFSRGIWSAAVDGDIDKVKSLLKRNPSLVANKRDSSGYTALHYAARNGHLSVCSALILAGATVNVQTTSGGVTPLHRACYSGHKDIVLLLLKSGGAPELTDHDGMTSLHKACESCRVDVIKILHGYLPDPSASMEQVNKRGLTPFDLLNKHQRISNDEKLYIKELYTSTNAHQ